MKNEKKNTHKVALVHAVQNEVLCVKGGADLTVLMDGLFWFLFVGRQPFGALRCKKSFSDSRNRRLKCR
jgi:hypothetical protein